MSYSYDADQDRLAEIEIIFQEGVPQSALAAVLKEPADGYPAGIRRDLNASSGHISPDVKAGDFAFPVRDEERLKVKINWERYPAVLSAELEGRRYLMPPFAFFYSPVRLAGIFSSDEFLYPERNPFVGISRRSLVSFASVIEQPGREVQGALERIELVNGIPQRSKETLNGRVVSETEYRLGRPFLQRIDLDLDGRLETIRRFRQIQSVPLPDEFLDFNRVVENSESDWNGDGVYETGERILPDGRTERSWDMDGDGLRERREIH